MKVRPERQKRDHRTERSRQDNDRIRTPANGYEAKHGDQWDAYICVRLSVASGPLAAQTRKRARQQQHDPRRNDEVEQIRNEDVLLPHHSTDVLRPEEHEGKQWRGERNENHSRNNQSGDGMPKMAT